MNNGTVVYVDGTPRLTTTITIATQGQGMYIGAANNGTADWFNGSIDDAAVYDRNLSPAEIAAHYRAGQ